jgi:hypothetical protein
MAALVCCQWVTAVCTLTENLGESADVREVTDGFDLECYHCLWQVKGLIVQQKSIRARQDRRCVAARST